MTARKVFFLTFPCGPFFSARTWPFHKIHCTYPAMLNVLKTDESNKETAATLEE